VTTGSVGFAEITGVVLLSSLFSIGGGNGPVVVIQDRWVGQGLLDPALFAWAVALGYLSPGPKAGFLSGIGYYMHGLPGALAAIIGIIIPTCVGAAAVSYGYQKLEPVIRWITLPAGFVIAGMIVAAAWDLVIPMKLNGVEIAATAIIAVLVGWRNPEPFVVVLGSAAAGLGWWFLGR
jgi:chromate transporter